MVSKKDTLETQRHKEIEDKKDGIEVSCKQEPEDDGMATPISDKTDCKIKNPTRDIDNPQNEKNISNHICDEGLVSSPLKNRQKNYKWAKNVNRHFFKEIHKLPKNT